MFRKVSDVLLKCFGLYLTLLGAALTAAPSPTRPTAVATASPEACTASRPIAREVPRPETRTDPVRADPCP